jgi:hypothetical protein
MASTVLERSSTATPLTVFGSTSAVARYVARASARGPSCEAALPHSLRSLSRMSALNPFPTLPAMAYMNAKLNPLHPRLGNLGLILGNQLGFLQPASTLRTLLGQRYFDGLIHFFGNLAPTATPILRPRLAPGFLGMSFGCRWEKGAACRFADRNASSKARRRCSFSAFSSSIEDAR